MSDGSSADSSSRAVRILLYTLIPAAREFQPIPRSAFAFLRNRIRRHLELAAWRITGIWRAHFSTFEDFTNTNRGDIAIRVGVRRQLERLFTGRPLVIDEVAWGDLGRAIAEFPTPYDLIVIAGGGFLFADPEGRLPPRFAADIDALTRTATPVAAVSIGLNHLIMGEGAGSAFHFNPDQHALIARFLDRVDLISVRDEATARALSDVPGVTARIQVIIDSAFLLVSTFDVERRRRRIASTAEAPLSVGLNVAFHGAHATTINRHLLREMVVALEDFSERIPVRYVYFVHSDSERTIVDALRLCGLSIETVEGDVDTMLTAYMSLDMHMGQMLHSCILATAVGVPTLGVAYDTKSTAFFKLLGVETLCVDATTLDRHSLRAAMEQVMADRSRIAAQLAARGAALRTDAAGFYKQLGEMVVEPIAGAPTAAQQATAQQTTQGPLTANRPNRRNNGAS